jgi:hypothetical protein
MIPMDCNNQHKGAIMNTVSIEAIQERLKQLPPEKLEVVYDFVSYMADHYPGTALETMLATEAVLKRDWERKEEDEAWADL